MKWHCLNRGAWAGEDGWWVLKVRHWPFAPWDVYRNYMIGDERRFERFAGGFWTRAGAQQWATIEQLAEQRV